MTKAFINSYYRDTVAELFPLFQTNIPVYRHNYSEVEKAKYNTFRHIPEWRENKLT